MNIVVKLIKPYSEMPQSFKKHQRRWRQTPALALTVQTSNVPFLAQGTGITAQLERLLPFVNLDHVTQHRQLCGLHQPGRFESWTRLFHPSCPCSGELRTQKLKSHLLRTQSLKVLPLKPGVGQCIAVHATLTAGDFFLAKFYPLGPFTCIFPKPLPNIFQTAHN